ncbi:MAG: dipeptidase, partial [Pseudorhodobacter sp.]|nr:dipeptidase [Pseudorhodobacter sp.]
KGRWEGAAWIEAEMQARAARPEKIGLTDVFWSISTARLTGDTAGYGQVVPLVHTSHPDLSMLWHAAVGPVTAPLLPVFMGQTSFPDAYGKHRYLTEGESARFLDRRKEEKAPQVICRIPQGIEVGDSAVYHFKQLMHLAFQSLEGILPEVDQHWRQIEAAMLADLPAVQRSAEVLFAAGETALANRLLTDFSSQWHGKVLTDCKALAASAYVRLRAQGCLNMTDQPVAPPQLW